MSSTPIPTRYLDALKARLPGVDGSSLRLIDSGHANDAVVVDERLVVRFAKHEWSAGVMAAEVRVLAAPRLAVPVPACEVWFEGVVAYPFLPGRPLNPSDFEAMPAVDRGLMVGSIAAFLGELHAIPASEAADAGVGESDARCPADAWEGLIAEAERVLSPDMDASGRAEMAALFAAVRGGALEAGGEEVLIHGDLAACHLLWDGSTLRLAGVIDFGCAGTGDLALDIAALLELYGGEFLGLLTEVRPLCRSSLDRARVFAALYSLQRRVDRANEIG